VAQASALVEAGFDLANNVAFSIKDFASTIQAAQSSPTLQAVLKNAELVTADANELDNNIDMAAFDNSVNLRTELNDGNDSFNAGRGDEQIVGGGGTDVISLTRNDRSEDTVIYQNVTDGEQRPVTSVGFSNNPNDYREGSVLTVTINGQKYSHTVSSDDGDTFLDSDLIARELQMFAGELARQTVVEPLETMVGILIDPMDKGVVEHITLADLSAGGSYTVPMDKIFLSASDASFQNHSFSPSPNFKTAGEQFQAAGLHVFDVQGLDLESDSSFSSVMLSQIQLEYTLAEDYLSNLDPSVERDNATDQQLVAARKAAADLAEQYMIGKGGALSGIEVVDNGLVFYGQASETLNVQAGSDGVEAIVNDGLVTTTVIEFSTNIDDYVGKTNTDSNNNPNDTKFDRNISVTIDGVTISAVLVEDDPTASVAALKKALDDAMDQGGTLVGVLASAELDPITSTNLILIGHPDTIPTTDDKAPTFTVNSAIIEKAGVQQETQVSFSDDNADYYDGGTLSVVIAGETIEVAMVADDAAESVEALSVAINAALTGELANDALVAALESVDLDGISITLTAATEETDPPKVDATLSYAGEAQQATFQLEDDEQYIAYTDGTNPTDNTRAADVYFADGQAHVTITEVNADAIAGQSTIVSVGMATHTDTNQALVDAINNKINVVENGDDLLFNLLASATLGEDGTVTLIAKEPGKETFEITEVILNYQGVQQLATAQFSMDDADYYEGGTLSLTIDATPEVDDDAQNDIIITVDMLGEDSVGSVQALVEEMNTKISDEDTTLSAVLESSALGEDGGTITLTSRENTEHAFDISSAEVSTKGTQQQARVTFGGEDSDYFNDGSVGIDTTVDGVGSIGVTINTVDFVQEMINGSKTATIEALRVQIEDQLTGIESVTVNGGNLVLTAAEPADRGSEEFVIDITEVFTDVDSVTQVSEIDFSALGEDVFYGTDDAGNPGTVSVVIDDKTVTAEMVEGNKADTLLNLLQQIEQLAAVGGVGRDGAILKITAEDPGLDPLNVRDLSYTTPYVEGDKHEFTVQFGNGKLDGVSGSPVGRVLSLDVDGVTTSLEVTEDLLNGFDSGADQSESIVSAFLEQVITDHTGRDPASKLDLDTIGSSANTLTIVAADSGLEAMGDEIQVKVTETDGETVDFAGAIFELVNLGSDDVPSDTTSDGASIVDTTNTSSDAITGANEVRATITGGDETNDVGLGFDSDAVAGEDNAPLDQTIVNPGTDGDGNSDFFGDNAALGEDGVQQTVTNPDNGYNAINNSPQLNGEDSNNGVDNLFGSNPGDFKDDGLDSTYVNSGEDTGEDGLYDIQNGEDIGDRLNIFDGSGKNAGVAGELPDKLTDSDSDVDAFEIVIDDQGFAAFEWDAATVAALVGSEGFDVVNNFQTGGGFESDLIALEGALAQSTVNTADRGVFEDYIKGKVEAVVADGEDGFDLNHDEFGVVTSQTPGNSLSASDIGSVDKVAELLSNVFYLGGDGYSGDGQIDTSIFAVTAEDDASVTSIWAHTQSSDNDNTIGAHELTLLAEVNTTGGEFSYLNFATVQDNGSYLRPEEVTPVMFS
jgi:hypothetical protein